MKKAEAIRLVQVEKTHQIYYDCKNLKLLSEIIGASRNGTQGYYSSHRFSVYLFCNLKIIKLSEITEEEELDNTERVIEVFDGTEWVSRVLIMIKNNGAICWNGASTIEESKVSRCAFHWDEWREIQPKVELTNDEFEKLVGCKFENFKIKE